MLKEDYYLKFESNNKYFSLIKSKIDRREPVLGKICKEYPAGSKLLDVGCGIGRFLNYAKHHFNCTGIDISPQAIKIARSKNPSLRLIVDDIYNPQVLLNEKFKIVSAFDVLEHTNQPAKLLGKMSRLLDFGGSIIFSVPRKETLSYKVTQEKWWAFADTGHKSLLTTSEWENEVLKASLMKVGEFSSGIINYPKPPYKLKGWLMLVHTLTQTAAVYGMSLPNYLNDLIVWECKKNKG